MTYPSMFTHPALEARIQILKPLCGFPVFANLDELYPDLRSESGEVSSPPAGEVGQIKYLVQGETVFLKELGGVDDGIFGCVGCFVTDVEYPLMHGAGDRGTYWQYRRLPQGSSVSSASCKECSALNDL